MIEYKLLTGQPLFDPGQALYGAIFSGGESAASTTRFTVGSADDYRIVFKGDFDVTGGVITAGTVTKFSVFAGDTKVSAADGYEIDAAALYNAFLTDDIDAIQNLIFDVPVKIRGSSHDDDMRSGDFGDKLLGKDGNDRLDAGFGDDVLKGGKGNDALFGGEGSETLHGGGGKDVFYFTFDSAFPPSGFDKIKDFQPGKDTIQLVDFNFDVGPKPGYLDASNFHKGSAAADGDDFVIYQKSSGKIFYDADGNGTGDQFLLAKVSAGTKLHADDFFVGGGLLMA